MGFGARLAAQMDANGPLCVGIDPSPALLDKWGLPDAPEGLLHFGRAVVEAADRNAAAVKPQIAFFERHGARGIAALERTLEYARELSVLTIMDAKRGDIDSTMEGYADAYLKPGAPLEVDAVTVSPYLGFDSLMPAISLALGNDKGVFVLCLTSNPEGAAVQHSTGADGVTVAGAIAQRAAEINAGSSPLGDVGLVVGATVGQAVATLPVTLAQVNGPILAPGVGAQGAGTQELADTFGDARRQVLAHQSRSVLASGPFVEKMRGAIQAASGAAQYALRPE